VIMAETSLPNPARFIRARLYDYKQLQDPCVTNNDSDNCGCFAMAGTAVFCAVYDVA
jgi:hypothetical protein